MSGEYWHQIQEAQRAMEELERGRREKELEEQRQKELRWKVEDEQYRRSREEQER